MLQYASLLTCLAVFNTPLSQNSPAEKMVDAPPPKRAKLVEQLVVPANEAITFKLVLGGKALLHSSSFCLV